MKQKDIFLSGEGDSWFERNHDHVATRDYSDDPVVRSVAKICDFESKSLRILEVGCGEAKRLSYLTESFACESIGLEPSAKAVATANENGIKCIIGTADHLPFEAGTFDVIIFGFCLYLCDEEDLFKISQEAHRVGKDKSWIVINDFYAKSPYKNPYHHKDGVQSHKMDYRKLFDWHPDISCFYHEVYGHQDQKFTDNYQDWVALSVLRKNINDNQ